MGATKRRRVEGRACVDVDAPASWTPVAGDAPRRPDLVLLGPRRGRGPRPRVSVTVFDGAGDREPLGDATARVWESLRREHPHAVLTSSDMWPHPVWGEGRLVQTARVGAESTTAHDCYVFADAGRTVQIETECALRDLLPLEEQFADIVAHVRPKGALS